MIAAFWLLANGVQAQVVAEVGGKPVDASELADGDTHALRGNGARERIAGPAIAAFLASHRHEWRLTDDEIAVATAAVQRAFACQPSLALENEDPERTRWIASALASGEKAQRFIHARFGGGRILFQQAGAEAYDATYRLLLHLEQEGAFVVHDPQLRADMLSYWEEDHGHVFLPGDAWQGAYDPAAVFITCDQDATRRDVAIRR